MRATTVCVQMYEKHKKDGGGLITALTINGNVPRWWREHIKASVTLQDPFGRCHELFLVEDLCTVRKLHRLVPSRLDKIL